ncbi:Wd repeat protein [Thalictrum thalictroides]|uniref:Wd repeat protein n=1 Tax=Thalictrum thalictroides TaxID=46969 RepID=A0A7J6VRP5_THATH|nr:Wd repeat protein [Thalictrum thalictroides]
MQTITLKPHSHCNTLFVPSSTATTPFSRQYSLLNLSLVLHNSISPFCGSFQLSRNSVLNGGRIRAVNEREVDYISPWEEKAYEILPDGRRIYFDEQDIASFLDPPKELIPLDPASFNPAKYIWKKIGDIPEERRHRLLYLLKPRLVSRLWEIAGTRYEDAKLVKQSASILLSDGDNVTPLELWNCRTSGGPVPLAWINFFKKAIFRCRDGQTYGRIIIDGTLIAGLANSFSPLYFSVRQQKDVMATEEPCDVAYEFGDGLLDVDYPDGFPRPVKHPWPFNDHVVVYVRHVGPGVLVAQAWQEGIVLDQVPKKLCGEIVMVKDYSA